MTQFTNATQRQTYDGRELRPFEGRPGSMDAFKHPSLTADGLKPYVGPKPQCVGRPVDLPVYLKRDA